MKKVGGIKAVKVECDFVFFCFYFCNFPLVDILCLYDARVCWIVDMQILCAKQKTKYAKKQMI